MSHATGRTTFCLVQTWETVNGCYNQALAVMLTLTSRLTTQETTHSSKAAFHKSSDMQQAKRKRHV